MSLLTRRASVTQLFFCAEQLLLSVTSSLLHENLLIQHTDAMLI